MRRVSVGNFVGARRCWQKDPVDDQSLAQYEARCICASEGDGPVEIRQVVRFIKAQGPESDRT
jgi:hypothetical protein